MPQTCPKCGHPGLMQPLCPLCGWQPAPPPAETRLLVDDQVVTVRWRVVAGVPVGDPWTLGHSGSGCSAITTEQNGG